MHSLIRQFSMSALAVFGVMCCSVSSAASCPSLDLIQSSADRDWEASRLELRKLFDQCLLSSEYFALLGAAQLNTGRLPEAMESLERALLLNPDNGAALIDYSEALLLDGQLFAALEANDLLLSRASAPAAIREQIKNRQRDWVELTKQTSWQLDLAGGYDTNLNGAPDDDSIALTLSGEPIRLKLNDEYRSIEGAFLNTLISGRHQQLSPDYQEVFLGQARGRLSEDIGSDAVQVSARYTRLRSTGDGINRWGAGVNHLAFAGNSLYSGFDVGSKNQIFAIGKCTTFLSAALQRQVWHQQRRLDGLEVKATSGAICNLGSNIGHSFTLEGGFLHNSALQENRLGGNRDGWQIATGWRISAPIGEFTAQLYYTSILDGRGFSSLLENNARREINRTSLLIQYRKPFRVMSKNLEFLANVYHQNQHSNLALFRILDTSAELGLRWSF